MTELQRTKGSFKVVGKVKALRSKEDSNANGNEYRRLNFGVQTSPVNTIYTEIYGQERDYVKAYSSQDKKTIDVAWDDRDNDHGSYHVLGINLFLEPEEKGDKFRREVLVEWDAIPYIEEHLAEGDSVMVRGELQFSEYENKNGETVSQTRYKVQGISKLKNELDFDAEDFKETSAFEQEIIVNSVDVDKKEKTALVSAYVVNYKKEFMLTSFKIDGNRNERLFSEFPKRIRFGDRLKVYGLLVNRVDEEDSSESIDSEIDPFGSEKPNGLDRRTIRNYTQEILITGLELESWQKKLHTEEDFVVEDAVKDFGDTKNPFLDDSDDELPFSL